MERIRYRIKMALFTCYYYSIEIILNVRANSDSKKKFLLKLSPWLPVIFLRWIAFGIYEKTVGKIVARRFMRNDAKRCFRYELGIVAIAKDEGKYIKEWVAYHKSVGVDKIYLYDNGSSDNTESEIAEYIKSGFVKFISFPGKKMQIVAYNNAVKEYGDECRYMAFIDLDEFIVPTKDEPITDTIHRILKRNPYAGGIGINWALFGSSGYEKSRPTPVTQTFFRRADETAWPNFHVKTICNPRTVKNYISPHFPVYKLGFINIAPNGRRQYVWGNRYVDYSEIRCHHYFCKSKEEWVVKRTRGMADRDQSYDMDKFNEYDINDVFDDIMVRYSDVV